MGVINTRAKFDPAKDIPELTGKVAIVTGGNSGIGFATVQHLVRHGAKVYLAARSKERAEEAVERLCAAGFDPGKGTVEWLGLDLSVPGKVKQSAEEFLIREGRLDILVHCAGVMRRPYNIGPHGIQETMLVNHLSPFILTKYLLPIMTETAKDAENDVRIITLSSNLTMTLRGRSVRFRNLDDFNREFTATIFPADMLRYAQSKLANVLFAKALQKRLDTDGIPITVMSVHPGWVDTEGSRKDPTTRIPVLGPILRAIYSLMFTTASVGAYSTVFAATSPLVKSDRERYKGAYLVPPGMIATPPTSQAEDMGLAEELWETTEAAVKQMQL